MDLLVGEYDGVMQYFENTTISGIATLSLNSDLKLFPNPVKDVLKIESKQKIERIQVFNVLGKTSAVIENPGSEVSLSNLLPGMYAVKVTYAKGSHAVKKIQKQ